MASPAATFRASTPFYGQLVQFGKVLPWASGIPVAHKAST